MHVYQVTCCSILNYSLWLRIPVEAPSITVQSSSVTPTTIPLSWTSAGSVVDSYEVMWTAGDCPGVSGGSATVDGDTTSHTIEGLEEYITYTITVTATNAVGSAVSDQATQRTSEAGKTIFQVYEIHCNPYVLCVSHPLCSSFRSSHFSQCY